MTNVYFQKLVGESVTIKATHNHMCLVSGGCMDLLIMASAGKKVAAVGHKILKEFIAFT